MFVRLIISLLKKKMQGGFIIYQLKESLFKKDNKLVKFYNNKKIFKIKNKIN